MNQIRLFLSILILGLFAPALSGCGGEPSPEVQANFREAMKFYNARRMGKAESLFREVLIADGDFVEAHLMLGRLYYYENKFELAEIAFREAANLDAANLTSRYYLARIYSLKSSRHHEALAQLEYILEKNSEFIQAWRLRGEIHQRRGDLRQAIAAYNFAVNESKKMTLVHRKLARLYGEAQMTEKSQAAEGIARCLSAGDQKIRTGLRQEP